MAPWVLHDLRRSFVTHLNELGIAPPHHVIEAIVNHVSGHVAGVAGTYNKAIYLDERRRALDFWGQHLQSWFPERNSARGERNNVKASTKNPCLQGVVGGPRRYKTDRGPELSFLDQPYCQRCVSRDHSENADIVMHALNWRAAGGLADALDLLDGVRKRAESFSSALEKLRGSDAAAYARRAFIAHFEGMHVPAQPDKIEFLLDVLTSALVGPSRC